MTERNSHLGLKVKNDSDRRSIDQALTLIHHIGEKIYKYLVKYVLSNLTFVNRFDDLKRVKHLSI